VQSIPKITADTNILVSAFAFPSGIIKEIISLCIFNKITLCLSEDILTEFSTVMIRKFNYSSDELNNVTNFLRKISIITEPVSCKGAVKEDPADDKIIECAVGSNCDYIVSGDKHLLNLKHYDRIKIIKPAELLRLFP